MYRKEEVVELEGLLWVRGMPTVSTAVRAESALEALSEWMADPPAAVTHVSSLFEPGAQS